MPIRMSMISPMPFCPSFEPWAKLTPVQVSININRIHNGGGVSPLGARYSSGLCTKSLAIRRSRAAPQNPTIGENKREEPTSPAFAQLTPSPKTLPLERTEFASPTPIMEPIGVGARSWETKKPGAEIPNHGGQQKGKHHGESRSRANVQHQFDWKKGNHTEGDRS